MRGWILLGLLVVVLVTPGAVASDVPESAEDSRACASVWPGMVTVNLATCVRAVTATATWVINEVPDSVSN